MSKKCEDVMTRNPECCVAEDNVIVAVDIMRDINCGSVPVVESHETNKLVGIITDRDICLYVVGNELIPSDVKVGDCMTADPVSCKPEDSLETIINLMEENQIRRIVVTDDDNRVIGMISQGDIAVRSKEDPYKIYELLEEISEPAPI
jgi:CBS domain-containing protein